MKYSGVCVSLGLTGFILAVGTGSSAFVAHASKPGIGRITYVDKKYWGMRISGSSERDAAMNGLIHERDTLQTIAGQHVVVLLEDGTELLVGPSTRVEFRNWNKRNSDGRRERVIYLYTGLLKAKVRKVYSQDEPFLIESRHGVAAVRGTEFVVEAGSGGKLGRVLNLSAAERAERRSEVEVHTLEGEVHFASSRSALRKSEDRVSVSAGQTSLVRANMSRPQQPHSFDVKRFQSYLAKAAPGVRVNIVRSTNNERRAELSQNARGSTRVSPAQPAFASLDQKKAALARAAGQLPAVDAGRGLASSQRVASKDERHRSTVDGVREAFQGHEAQMARTAHDGVGTSRRESKRESVTQSMRLRYEERNGPGTGVFGAGRRAVASSPRRQSSVRQPQPITKPNLTGSAKAPSSIRDRFSGGLR